MKIELLRDRKCDCCGELSPLAVEFMGSSGYETAVVCGACLSNAIGMLGAAQRGDVMRQAAAQRDEQMAAIVGSLVAAKRAGAD